MNNYTVCAKCILSLLNLATVITGILWLMVNNVVKYQNNYEPD